MVMGLGTFMSQKWYLVILIIIILILVFRAVVKTKKGKIIVDSISLRIPIVSPLVKKMNTATTARTLSSLTASAVPIVKSLEIVAGTLGNVHYKSAILAAAEKVKKGEKLSDSLSVYENLYPPIVFQMVKVGEETGETAKILLKLAEFFEDEVGNSTKNLASVIEPILMLIIGGVVGFFAISMVQPMYSMLGAIK
jgi:type IV pilus assembly protein PilC